MTAKLLLMSDIHITEPGTQIIGLDPSARFRRCLDHAAQHHADAAHLFLMGDLTHHGGAAQYEALKQCLADQPFPVTLMLGNHDRRKAFAEVFPELAAGFRQGRHRFGDTDVLYLDTLDEQARDRHSGHLCLERLDWLKTELEAGKGPLIILSHHHMLRSGFDGMDAIHLRNGTEVADLIAASGRCQMVINGHIHRIIVSSHRGVTHAMIKSPCHQMPMVLGAGASSLSVAEPGGYGVLLLDPISPLLHHVDVDLPECPVAFDAES